MSTDDKKRKTEFAVLMRKFYRDVQQNRILSESKKRQRIQKKISKKDRRLAAIRKCRIKRIIRGY